MRDPSPCEVCGQPTVGKYQVCTRSPECSRELHIRRYADPANRERIIRTNTAWAQAHPAERNGYRRARRERIRRRHVEWRRDNPTFIADWFEAPPEQWDDFMRRWEAAQPEHARKLREQAARLAWDGEITLTPALARLEIEGHSAIYAICGSYMPRAAPWPGGSVIRISWQSHAEGEAFAVAYAAGYRGGKGTLTLTHTPCEFCAKSFAGYARLLDLSQLTVWAADELFGSCRDGGRFSRPSRSRVMAASPG
jgi:hypothetical protein